LKPEKTILPINSLHFQLTRGGIFDKKKKGKQTLKILTLQTLFFKESRRPPLSFGLADFSSSAACTSLHFPSPSPAGASIFFPLKPAPFSSPFLHAISPFSFHLP
jgi:hypothetical protein